MKTYLQQRPWLWIVFGFSIVILALASMVTTAMKNLPVEVPLTHAESYADH
jgi:hypothetical protein